MHRVKGEEHVRMRRLGVAAAAMIAVFALGASCFFDTKTNLCEASGRRCRPGQVCAAHQDACIDLGGCGDGLISTERGEVCDDGNLFDEDGCSANCKSEEICGNGIEDTAVGESCDDGNTVGGDGCSADCVKEVCGNGILDPMEVCDDGNASSSDGCRADCMSNEACGNGVLDEHLGETCEFMSAPFPGPVLNTEMCDSDCTAPMCGDGHHNPEYDMSGSGDREECDAGVMGMPTDSPGCDADCTFAGCGDGHLNMSAGEECDEGDANSNVQPDRCRTDCRNPYCGDRVVDTGEACDDNNNDNHDLCPNGMGGTCEPARCGDDLVRTMIVPGDPDYGAPEECDDGATDLDGDGRINSNTQADACREDCRKAFCGDGVIDNGEVCDPGGMYGNGEVGCDGSPFCLGDCSGCSS